VEAVVILIPLGFILVVILFRVAAGAMDHDRIRRYIDDRGGRVLSLHWAPFSRGWFGEKSNRLYRVRWSEDTIVRFARHLSREEELEEENRRLREELEELRRGQPARDSSTSFRPPVQGGPDTSSAFRPPFQN
jgi:hypothetical protein